MRCKNCNCKIQQDINGWYHPEKAVNWDKKGKSCSKAQPKSLKTGDKMKQDEVIKMNNESEERLPNGEAKYWTMDYLEENPHFIDLRNSMKNEELTALIDEDEGGIIAYFLPSGLHHLKKFGFLKSSNRILNR